MPVTKTDGGVEFKASDYADVPDSEMPSTWKLRLAEGSSGNFTVAQIARAITAMQPGGFRGNRVEIGDDKATVVRKINAAIGKSDGDDTQKENLRERLDAVKEYQITLDSATKSFAEKCGYDVTMPTQYWEPYNPYKGITSFSDYEQKLASDEYAVKVSFETSTLQGILNEITNNPDLSAAQKSSMIQAAADDYRIRMDSLELGTVPSYKEGKRMSRAQLGIFKGAVDQLKKLMNWAGYESEDDDDKNKESEKNLEISKLVEDVTKGKSGFKIYRQKDGSYRWLSVSSNSFEDLDRELFTTKALEEAVDYADSTGERGPLLVYHVPSAEIGQTDFQAMEGRFLIESGTFDDTPLGQKAVEYFSNTDEEHQVSIGFEFESGDEKDGVFDWVRIKERSITPYGKAANPWTEFKVVEGAKVNEEKKATLTKIFGPDLVEDIVANAGAKSKDLETAGVRFKELSPELQASLSNMVEHIKAMPDGEAKIKMQQDYEVIAKAAGTILEKKEGESGSAGSDGSGDSPSIGNEQLTQLATFITDLSQQIETVTESVSALQSEVKALKASDDDKLASLLTPRWAGPVGGAKASELGKEPDEAAILALSQASKDAQTSPVSKYVRQIG